MAGHTGRVSQLPLQPGVCQDGTDAGQSGVMVGSELAVLLRLRSGSVAEALAEVNCNPLIGRNPVRLDLKCHASLMPSPSPVRKGTV